MGLLIYFDVVRLGLAHGFGVGNSDSFLSAAAEFRSLLVNTSLPKLVLFIFRNAIFCKIALVMSGCC